MITGPADSAGRKRALGVTQRAEGMVAVDQMGPTWAPPDDEGAAGVEIDQPGAPVEATVEQLLGDWDEDERREYEDDLEAIEAAERAALVDGMGHRFASFHD